MSNTATAWAMDQTSVGGVTKFVLVVLASNSTYDEETGSHVSWTPQERIASACGVSERTVRYKLDELVDAGLISIIRERDRDGRLNSNVYRLKFDQRQEPPAPPAPPADPPPAPEAKAPPAPEADDDGWLPFSGGEIAGPKKYLAKQEDLLRTPWRDPAANEPEARDAVWDSLVLLFGEPSNQNTRGKRNKAVKLIKESLNGGFVGDEIRHAEIGRRAARWQEIFSGASMTDIALANNWDSLASARPAGGHDPIRAMQEREREERLADEALALPPEESQKRLRELMDSMQGVGKEMP